MKFNTRKRLISQYSFEVGSDGFMSPGSSMFGNFLPKEISTPNEKETIWNKIPNQLKIIKPLEGSITLNHWQKLAKPSLDGIFEERKGIFMKGSKTANKIAQTAEVKFDLLKIFL